MAHVPEKPIQVGALALHQMRCLDPVVCRAEPSEQERREARAVLVAVLCDDESSAALGCDLDVVTGREVDPATRTILSLPPDRAHREALRASEALMRYGRHDDDCPQADDPSIMSGGPCDCGLDAACYKTHPDMVPFDELEPREQAKDGETS